MPDKNALLFISSRTNPLAFTSKRINAIIHYIIHCYNLQLKDKITYSKLGKSSKQKFEDYLKTKLVDDYLRKNKDYFKKINSGIEEIRFGKEETELYINSSLVEQEDKIDIYISELGLQKVWSKDNKQEVYFAVECKRIETISDSKHYVSDIQKFADRDHTSLRLPFECMIAFIENSTLNHDIVSTKVTEILKAVSAISTIQYLLPVELYANFEGSYTSLHNKNFNKKEVFSVYHLLLDYSKIVIN